MAHHRPHFCAGVVEGADGVILQAAPIYGGRGKNIDVVLGVL